ncbi:MAG TPA: ABC transporter substrate-binding protein [Candidatus Polarisedimenticolia bacterium]|nr:ABC transporter substrate-binding protein [Candidatus Polarisedimenticolia bacterium]
MRMKLAAGTAVVALILAACGGGAAQKGTVKIAINPWVGYEADAAVVAYLLEKELGYKVEKLPLTEQISWEGFESGTVDVIIENWGHADLAQKYITDEKVAVDAGSTGVDGIIGWYVPPWMVTEYPDITDWNNLNKYADLFKTSESGDLGQLLDGDPSFVTNDEAIIKGLDLNYKVVYAGSEAALIESFRAAETNKTPLIGYFYEPQWFLAEVPLVHILLPEWTEGCDADPNNIPCDYAPYNDLNKIVSKKFADTGGDAYKLVTNFQWTGADQNLVAKYITIDFAGDADAAAKAAEKWIKDPANESKWKAWLP